MSYSNTQRGMIADIGIGMRVDRATANLVNGVNLFTIVGGRVLMTLLLGQVTTVMEAGANASKAQANPTTGTTTDLCATADMDAAEAGTLITISGTAATAMQLGKSGSVRGQDAPVVLAPGTIDWVAGAVKTGSVKFSIWYLPLDEGAYVAAA